MLRVLIMTIAGLIGGGHHPTCHPVATIQYPHAVSCIRYSGTDSHIIDLTVKGK